MRGTGPPWAAACCCVRATIWASWSVVKVCGVVAGAKYAAQVRGGLTFIDFGKPYPNAVFTALIFGNDRAKFGTPEKTLQGKQVCVTGQIRLYKGQAEIVLTDPKQLTEK